ncbi:hypothetical protein [Paracoccus spongiarum]|uniref:Uncharacterized protein n=1 Tax=Paracoccus spongiarum TaxID=3064387 RepID=A0ABT9JCQ4_9RHOB|nr:hypothetical protein [Paracoccus sp. 2205BS29-5]MDP5307395.1 hypothetical protein [Paracoccus sp. 2205BS29-5]
MLDLSPAHLATRISAPILPTRIPLMRVDEAPAGDLVAPTPAIRGFRSCCGRANHRPRGAGP